ncbi:ABC transporter permease [Desulfotignum balticum]|uniref:ABC transporter permease n=1 Tax=Desulfotignum balticum TaxID=115781 RepID=UPI00041BAD6C|nr:ABC transporter permease subunit [Desulfotignum balticum]
MKLFSHTLVLVLLFSLFALPAAILLLVGLAPGWRFPDLWPAQFSFTGIQFLITHQDQIVSSLVSSFLYSVATVLVTLGMCLTPAAAFARNRFAGKRLMEALVLTPALVPPMTFAMGLHVVFIRLSLADTVAGVVLILALFTYPYMFRALVTGFQTLGEEYRVCARNLGAGPVTIFWRVELPLLVPAMIAGGSVVFLVAFSEYFLVFLMGGGTVPSFTGFLMPLLASSNRSLAAILTLIFLLLPILLFFVIDGSLMRSYRKKGMV